MPKISFCITCMNRLEHIKKTLPINISNALADSENIEFILLDYNSTDGLADWVKTTMIGEIESLQLKYFKTFQPQAYHRSHSRNLAFRLATGDILINLDADNFIGKGFAKFILKRMTVGAFMAVVEPKFGVLQFVDTTGRVCVWKDDFLKIHGYDESMAGYGFEDTDLKARLRKSGLRTIPITNPKFLGFIKHDNHIRVENERINKDIFSVSVRQLKPFSSEIIFFFKDNYYKKAIIVDNFFSGGFSEKIKVIDKLNQLILEKLSDGYWIQIDNCFKIDNQSILSINDATIKWFFSEDTEVLTELIYNFSNLINKKKYFENANSRSSLVNYEGFGRGEVLKNFKEKIVL